MFTINYKYPSDELYDFAKFLKWDSLAECYDVIPSWFLAKLRDLPFIGTYTVTTEEYAPDAITKVVWGSEKYYALLLIYNDINSVFSIKAGTVLRYPAWSEVEKLFLQARII